MADYDKLARDIRQRHLPWDEFSYLAAPGDVLDQLQADIALALERAELEGEIAATEDVLNHNYTSGDLKYILAALRTRLAELKEGE